MFRGTKVVFVGQTNVGKTSILYRFENDYLPETTATVGAAFLLKKVMINNKEVVLHIWDTSGQERYNSVSKIYFRGVGCCVFVFDITDIDSLNKLQTWKRMADEIVGDDVNVKYILVGNKNDRNLPKIDFRIIDDWSKQNNMDKFIITSAATGENINMLIKEIASMVNRNKEHNDDTIINFEKQNNGSNSSYCYC